MQSHKIFSPTLFQFDFASIIILCPSPNSPLPPTDLLGAQGNLSALVVGGEVQVAHMARGVVPTLAAEQQRGLQEGWRVGETWGLGQQALLAEFEDHVGVDFAGRRVQRAASASGSVA